MAHGWWAFPRNHHEITTNSQAVLTKIIPLTPLEGDEEGTLFIRRTASRGHLTHSKDLSTSKFMARFKTTWEDLAHLDYSRDDVWNSLNEKRGGTMLGPLDGGVALNEGIALQWAWYCYNEYKGPASPEEPVYRTVNEDEVLWEYDNTTKDHVRPLTT